jgi:hypothetical protein
VVVVLLFFSPALTACKSIGPLDIVRYRMAGSSRIYSPKIAQSVTVHVCLSVCHV